MTMTKAESAMTLFERIGLNKREAKELVDRFFEEIAAALEAGDFVKLSGFGNFALRENAQRPGRNPKTGQQIPILARRVVTFHPSSKPLRGSTSNDATTILAQGAGINCYRCPRNGQCGIGSPT